MRLLLLCCLIAINSASAQDTLFLKNGQVLIGRVKVERRDYILERKGFDRHVKSSSLERVAYSSKPFSRTRFSHTFARRSDKNLVTMNAPAYCYVGTYPGVSVGLEYQRFPDAGGKLSIGVGAHYFWSGTVAFGKVYRETRANIKGNFLEFNFSYHPAGNAGRVDPGIGISVPLGTLHRLDVTDVGKTYPLTTDDGSHFFAALLLQGEVCFHNYRHYVFALYGSCGPMVPAGATGGLSGQIGFKVGGRF